MERRNRDREDLIGRTVGRLLVVDYIGHNKYACMCECGNTCHVTYWSLRPHSKTPATRSCGCLQKECARLRAGKEPSHGRSSTHQYKMYTTTKRSARVRGLDFNLSVDDIVIPELCPLLGIKLKTGKGKLCDYSATVDRLDNSKGYIKDNVWVISMKANSMKRDSSIEEIEMLARNLRARMEERS